MCLWKMNSPMTDEELFELVRKNYTEQNYEYLKEQTSEACKYCQNNPANGGSGVCNCILGSPSITRTHRGGLEHSRPNITLNNTTLLDP